MPVEGAVQTTKPVGYTDILIFNSTKNMVLQPTRDEYDVSDPANPKKTGTKPFGDQVMINDGVFIDPVTLQNVSADAPGAVPAFTHIRQRFAAEWKTLGDFAEAYLQANGKL